MVRLSVTLTARRGQAETLAAALRSVMVQAQRKPTCVHCELSADVRDANTLRYVEEWVTETDLRCEIRSERFRRLIAVIEAAAQRPKFEVQVVSASFGLEYARHAVGSDIW